MGNTVSHIKPQTAHISRNLSQDIEPRQRLFKQHPKLKLSCPTALWKIRTLPLLNTLKMDACPQEASCRPETFGKYEYTLKLITIYFHETKLSKINATSYQNIINELANVM